MKLLKILILIPGLLFSSFGFGSAGSSPTIMAKIEGSGFNFSYPKSNYVHEVTIVKLASKATHYNRSGNLAKTSSESYGVILEYSKTLREILEMSIHPDRGLIEIDCNLGMQIAILIDNGGLDKPFKLSLNMDAKLVKTDRKIAYVALADPLVEQQVMKAIRQPSLGEWVIKDRDKKYLGLYESGFRSLSKKELVKSLEVWVIVGLLKRYKEEDVARFLRENKMKWEIEKQEINF